MAKSFSYLFVKCPDTNKYSFQVNGYVFHGICHCGKSLAYDAKSKHNGISIKINGPYFKTQESFDTWINEQLKILNQ